jgi:hypothetical protein
MSEMSVLSVYARTMGAVSFFARNPSSVQGAASTLKRECPATATGWSRGAYEPPKVDAFGGTWAYFTHVRERGQETNRFVCKNSWHDARGFEIEAARFEIETGFFVHTEGVTGSNPVSPM